MKVFLWVDQHRDVFVNIDPRRKFFELPDNLLNWPEMEVYLGDVPVEGRIPNEMIYKIWKARYDHSVSAVFLLVGEAPPFHEEFQLYKPDDWLTFTEVEVRCKSG